MNYDETMGQLDMYIKSSTVAPKQERARQLEARAIKEVGRQRVIDEFTTALHEAERDWEAEHAGQESHEAIMEREDQPVELEPEPDSFSPSRPGFQQFLGSEPMQRLLVEDPARYKDHALNFLDRHNLLRNGTITPVEVGVLAQQVDQFRGLPLDARHTVLSKAMKHADPQPQPHRHPKTAGGLAAFSDSDEMRALRRKDPAKFRELCLDFVLEIVPRPTPEQISSLRQKLQGESEQKHEFAKAMGVAGSHLTHGQSVLVQNFGTALGDPNVWMQHS